MTANIQPDSYTTLEGTTLTVTKPGVLGNDTTVIIATPISPPQCRTAVLTADVSFVYLPVPDFVGSITFTDQDVTGTVVSAPAAVTVTVTVAIPRGSTIVGAGGNDPLRGTPENHISCGLRGNHTISGGDGNKSLFGGSGIKWLAGSNDIIYGRSRADTLTGGAGTDLPSGNFWNDLLSGDAGTTWCPGTTALTSEIGVDGRDGLVGGQGLDRLAGDNGDDPLDGRGRAGGDIAYRVLGTDTFARAVADTVTGVP